MTKDNHDNQDALQLYMKYVLNQTISPLISEITPEIPRTFQHTIDLGVHKASHIRNTPAWESQKEGLARILKKTTKKYSIFSTMSVKSVTR